MKRALLIFIILVMIPVVFLSLLYEVTFDRSGYDILLRSKMNNKTVYGILYKGSFEVWEFGENIHSGIAERRLFSSP